MAESGDIAPQLPETITVYGRTRAFSQHIRDSPHLGITAREVERVLNDWLLRGVRTESDGSRSNVYFGFAPGMDEMVRVAVSEDDALIITAFRDRTATRHWNRRNRQYFTGAYTDLEVRNASQL